MRAPRQMQDNVPLRLILYSNRVARLSLRPARAASLSLSLLR